MLAQRILTALVLLALLLPTLWFSNPWPFVGLTLVLISAAAWEWARLNGLAAVASIACGVALAAIGLWLALALRGIGESNLLWLAAAAAWLVGGMVV
jgi:phosphatidate cytidylyltransferase